MGYYCPGSVLAPDSDDICLPVTHDRPSVVLSVGKVPCPRSSTSTHPLMSRSPLTYKMRQLDQIIFTKHLWKVILCSLLLNEPAIEEVFVWRALCPHPPVSWSPGSPTHQQGLPRLCFLTTGYKEHSWITTHLCDPLRVLTVLTPTDISCTIRHHVLVTV